MDKKKTNKTVIVILSAALVISAAIIVSALKGVWNGGIQQREAVVTKDKNAECSVDFYDGAGTKLKNITVKAGSNAVPPDYIPPDGFVFLAWNPSTVGVEEDMKVYPNLVKISDVKNVLYANTQYASTGREIYVPLYLGGDVCLNRLAFEISYDRDVLKLIGTDDIITGAECKEDAKNPIVHFSLSAKQNMDKPVRLVMLRFSVIGGSTLYTDLPFTVTEASKTDGEKEVPADNTIYKGKIYIY